MSITYFLKNIKGKKVVIWGLGLNRGGLEAAKFFAKSKADVTVIDLKKKQDLQETIKELEKFSNIKFVLGKQEELDFLNSDLIIKNHAIPWNNELVRNLLKKGKRIETDITLFFKFFPGKIIGITGTKGKTTTTTLISKILRAAGKDVLLGGNIRISLFSFLKERTLQKNKIAVLELSSFQLEDLMYVKRSPEIGIVTNIFRDHLNRYRTLSKYIASKKGICSFQKKNDFLVLNADNKYASEYRNCGLGKKLWFSTGEVKNGMRAEDSKIYDVEKGKRKLFINVSNPILKISHNLSNFSAVCFVCKVLKINKKILEKVAVNFKGVPYRLEKRAKIKGVDYYNDTTATIPDAAIENINSFDKVILITGGADKDLKFERFGKTVAKKAKAVVLLPGNATENIKKEILKNNSKLNYAEAKSMKEAVIKAHKLAKPGDTVLLSPGCASFGLFQNEFDRGDQFNECIGSLKVKKGGSN